MTHTEIVENKRLSEVLAWVKERQDELCSPKVKTNSEKGGSVRTGRTSSGPRGLAARSSSGSGAAAPRAALGEAAAMVEVSAASPTASSERDGPTAP